MKRIRIYQFIFGFIVKLISVLVCTIIIYNTNSIWAGSSNIQSDI